MLIRIERDADAADRGCIGRCRIVHVDVTEVVGLVAFIARRKVDGLPLGVGKHENAVAGLAQRNIGLGLVARPAVRDRSHAGLLRCRYDRGKQVVEGIRRRDDQDDLGARRNRMNPLDVEDRLVGPPGIRVARICRFGRRADDREIWRRQIHDGRKRREVARGRGRSISIDDRDRLTRAVKPAW